MAVGVLDRRLSTSRFLRMRGPLVFTLACLLVATLPPSHARANEPTTRPESDALTADVRTGMTEMRALIESPNVLLDPQKRAQIAPQAVPTMRKVLAALDELAAQDPASAERTAPLRLDLLSKLTLLADDAAERQLEQQAQSGGGKSAEAVAAKTALLRAGWWKASNDPD